MRRFLRGWWTQEFLQHGVQLFPVKIQKEMKIDLAQIISHKKGFFKKTSPGGSLDYHTDPCFHGSVVYVIEETGCKSDFKIKFKDKEYAVDNYGAGKIINLLPNTEHSVSHLHDNSGKHCSSESVRIVAVCFF